jgi:hypothetical protein
MKLTAALIAATALFVGPAHATLKISNKPTRNVDCDRGLCAARAPQANLNVNDLETLLATSDIRILTQDEEFQDIEILSPITWASNHSLSFEPDGDDEVYVRAAITVQGTAHLTFVSAGGPQFEKGGAVHFWDMASQLRIDGDDYKLVDSIADLSVAVATNPNANIAFANDYDAGVDGRYSYAPVQKAFGGILEGLGNRISHLSVSSKRGAGLFAKTTQAGTVIDLGLVKTQIRGKSGANAGALAVDNLGQILNCFATGSVRGSTGAIGGLAGLNSGVIANSWTETRVFGGGSTGGIAGKNADDGNVSNTYAMGAITGGDNDDVGGLVGTNTASVQHSYATGLVSAGSHSHVGGLLGSTSKDTTNAYWDIETSGTKRGVGHGSKTGVIGLTTANFLAQIPAGFDLTAWGQSVKENGGFPYLNPNPPLK